MAGLLAVVSGLPLVAVLALLALDSHPLAGARKRSGAPARGLGGVSSGD